jgi:hypothetical protein
MSGRLLTRLVVGGTVALSVVIPVVGGAHTPAGAASPAYSIVDIGSLGGASGGSTALAINANGDVAGWSTLSSAPAGLNGNPGNVPTHAILFKGGALTDLGARSDGSTVANAINSSDVAVGYRLTPLENGAAEEHALKFSGGTVTDLTPAGSLSAGAFGINDGGTIVGYYVIPQVFYAVQFNGAGSVTPLSTIQGGVANGVSSGGTAVGGVLSPSGNDEAVTFSGGTATVLGSEPQSKESEAHGISANGGYAVGWFRDAGTGQLRGIEYTLDPSSPSATDLGLADAGRDDEALAVNDAGQAVGWGITPSDQQVALMFNPGQAPTDLNTLLPAGSGWTLQGATGINNSGQIVGYGRHNGIPRGFVMTPVLPTPPIQLVICRPPYPPLTGLINSIPTLGPPIAAVICEITAALQLSL